MRALLAGLIACSSPAPRPEPVAIVTPPAAAPADAPSPDAAPPLDAAPSVRFESWIVAGAATESALRTLVEDPRVACLGSSTTTELLLLVADGKITLRNAWQAGKPIDAACLRPVYPEAPVTMDSETTSVYVVARVDEGAPPAPAPPDRRADFQAMFCDLETLSGADKLPIEKKQDAMRTWARANIRHPAPYELARQISLQSPAGLKHFVQARLRAEGVKRCALQRI